MDIIDCFFVLSADGQQVGLHNVRNFAKVSASFAIAIDINLIALDHAGNPLGGVGLSPVGVLTWPKHIIVAQADVFQVVSFAEHIRIKLVQIFSDVIGT
jgi:hypothetical protein